MFSPSRKQHNNKESLATDLFQRLNFEQSFFKTFLFFINSFLQNFIKNNLCKVSRRRARDRDRNPSRPRHDLRPSRPRPRLQKTGLETRLETETKSQDSITSNRHQRIYVTNQLMDNLYVLSGILFGKMFFLGILLIQCKIRCDRPSDTRRSICRFQRLKVISCSAA